MQNNEASIMLMGGLGNAIQALPFANAIKKKYDKVTALFYVDIYPPLRYHLADLFKNVFDDFFDFHLRPNIFASPLHESIRNLPQNKDLPNLEYWNKSECFKWFEVHNQELSKSLEFNIHYDKTEINHEVILWPGCKSNWRSKQYTQWVDLSKKFKDVAIVGLPGEGPVKFPDHVKDYRGLMPLAEVGGLIKNSKAFIGNEGGVSHYSNSISANTFILMGGSDSTKNLISSPNLFPISLNLDCQPCQYNPNKTHHASEGCAEMTCLNSLSPSIILEKVLSVQPSINYE